MNSRSSDDRPQFAGDRMPQVHLARVQLLSSFALDEVRDDPDNEGETIGTGLYLATGNVLNWIDADQELDETGVVISIYDPMGTATGNESGDQILVHYCHDSQQWEPITGQSDSIWITFTANDGWAPSDGTHLGTVLSERGARAREDEVVTIKNTYFTASAGKHGFAIFDGEQLRIEKLTVNGTWLADETIRITLDGDEYEYTVNSGDGVDKANIVTAIVAELTEIIDQVLQELEDGKDENGKYKPDFVPEDVDYYPWRLVTVEAGTETNQFTITSTEVGTTFTLETAKTSPDGTIAHEVQQSETLWLVIHIDSGSTSGAWITFSSGDNWTADEVSRTCTVLKEQGGLVSVGDKVEVVNNNYFASTTAKPSAPLRGFAAYVGSETKIMKFMVGHTYSKITIGGTWVAGDKITVTITTGETLTSTYTYTVVGGTVTPSAIATDLATKLQTDITGGVLPAFDSMTSTYVSSGDLRLKSTDKRALIASVGKTSAAGTVSIAADNTQMDLTWKDGDKLKITIDSETYEYTVNATDGHKSTTVAVAMAADLQVKIDDHTLTKFANMTATSIGNGEFTLEAADSDNPFDSSVSTTLTGGSTGVFTEEVDTAQTTWEVVHLQGGPSQSVVTDVSFNAGGGGSTVAVMTDVTLGGNSSPVQTITLDGLSLPQMVVVNVSCANGILTQTKANLSMTTGAVTATKTTSNVTSGATGSITKTSKTLKLSADSTVT